MTGSISSEQLQHLLTGYVLYDLSPEESATLTELLAANPDLQQDIDQLQQALEIAYDGDPVSPPAHLRMALLQTAAQPVDGAKSVSAPVAIGLRPHRWGRIWVAAAAALIAGLSLSNLMLWRTLQLERASQPKDETLTIALGSPEDGASSGQAQVVINPSTLAGSLTVENLPPLEPGAVYVLWTVVDPSATATVDQKTLFSPLCLPWMNRVKCHNPLICRRCTAAIAIWCGPWPLPRRAPLLPKSISRTLC